MLRRVGEICGSVPLSLALLISKPVTCTRATISVGKVADNLSRARLAQRQETNCCRTWCSTNPTPQDPLSRQRAQLKCYQRSECFHAATQNRECYTCLMHHMQQRDNSDRNQSLQVDHLIGLRQCAFDATALRTWAIMPAYSSWSKRTGQTCTNTCCSFDMFSRIPRSQSRLEFSKIESTMSLDQLRNVCTLEPSRLFLPVHALFVSYQPCDLIAVGAAYLAPKQTGFALQPTHVGCLTRTSCFP